MRRVILVGAAAIGLGIVAFSWGQFWFGLCFILLGVLRLVGAWWARKPRETEPEIRLNLEAHRPLAAPRNGEEIGADGGGQQVRRARGSIEEPPASAPGENRPSRP